MKLLIIAPHQDDETIGCGGLIQKVTKRGGIVHVAILTNVSEGQKFDNASGKYKQYSGKQRDNEFKNAIEILKQRPNSISWECYFGEKWHHCLDKLNLSEIINRIEQTVLFFKPDILAFPSESWDQDHQVTNRACMSVIRPHFFSKSVLVYEVCGENHTYVPNLFITLSDEEAKRKIDALKCYNSQNIEKFHVTSDMSIQTNMHYRGKAVFAGNAETYMALRIVNNLKMF